MILYAELSWKAIIEGENDYKEAPNGNGGYETSDKVKEPEGDGYRQINYEEGLNRDESYETSSSGEEPSGDGDGQTNYEEDPNGD